MDKDWHGLTIPHFILYIVQGFLLLQKERLEYVRKKMLWRKESYEIFVKTLKSPRFFSKIPGYPQRMGNWQSIEAR